MPIPADDPIVNIPLVTPFNQRDDVDHGALERNVRRWLTTPATGFLVGSQTGEEFYLSETEKLAVAATVRDNLDERRFLMGGIDCPSVTQTLRRAEAFADVGAEVVRVRFPRGASLVEPYFRDVLPRCPVPVLLMHQNEPALFGMAAAPAAAPEVLAGVTNMDNVFGYVTDHDVRFEARVRRLVTRDRRFWICNGSLMLHGTLMGCNGTTTAFSNIWPGALDELLRLGMAGRYDEALQLQEHVQEIDAVMLPYRAAGVKAALQLLGHEGMRPRSPGSSPPPEVIRVLEALMQKSGLLAA
ncbi:MAG: dihydrodipicolinate synthase family protein [Fuerstiella sp.]|jgi:dihydrodipicolinate synthase/N-acetylneuraminate lyase|nr:dihydrodipicolinate synthase family protein [Fuerstiella sp.]